MGSAASLRQARQRSDEWRTHQLRLGVTVACKCDESKPRTWGGGQHCKAHSAMQSPWHAPQTRSTATALAVAQSGKQNAMHAKPHRRVCPAN